MRDSRFYPIPSTLKHLQRTDNQSQYTPYKGFRIGGLLLQNLRYVDDTTSEKWKIWKKLLMPSKRKAKRLGFFSLKKDKNNYISMILVLMKKKWKCENFRHSIGKSHLHPCNGSWNEKVKTNNIINYIWIGSNLDQINQSWYHTTILSNTTFLSPW